MYEKAETSVVKKNLKYDNTFNTTLHYIHENYGTYVYAYYKRAEFTNQRKAGKKITSAAFNFPNFNVSMLSVLALVTCVRFVFVFSDGLGSNSS